MAAWLFDTLDKRVKETEARLRDRGIDIHATIDQWKGKAITGLKTFGSEWKDNSPCTPLERAAFEASKRFDEKSQVKGTRRALVRRENPLAVKGAEILAQYRESKAISPDLRVVTFACNEIMGTVWDRSRVHEVVPNTQASRLGVCAGWTAVKVNDRAVQLNEFANETIVKMIQLAKRGVGDTSSEEQTFSIRFFTRSDVASGERERCEADNESRRRITSTIEIRRRARAETKTATTTTTTKTKNELHFPPSGAIACLRSDVANRIHAAHGVSTATATSKGDEDNVRSSVASLLTFHEVRPFDATGVVRTFVGDCDEVLHLKGFCSGIGTEAHGIGSFVRKSCADIIRRILNAPADSAGNDDVRKERASRRRVCVVWDGDDLRTDSFTTILICLLRTLQEQRRSHCETVDVRFASFVCDDPSQRQRVLTNWTEHAGETATALNVFCVQDLNAYICDQQIRDSKEVPQHAALSDPRLRFEQSDDIYTVLGVAALRMTGARSVLCLGGGSATLNEYRRAPNGVLFEVWSTARVRKGVLNRCSLETVPLKERTVRKTLTNERDKYNTYVLLACGGDSEKEEESVAAAAAASLLFGGEKTKERRVDVADEGTISPPGSLASSLFDSARKRQTKASALFASSPSNESDVDSNIFLRTPADASSGELATSSSSLERCDVVVKDRVTASELFASSPSGFDAVAKREAIDALPIETDTHLESGNAKEEAATLLTTVHAAAFESHAASDLFSTSAPSARTDAVAAPTKVDTGSFKSNADIDACIDSLLVHDIDDNAYDETTTGFVPDISETKPGLAADRRDMDAVSTKLFNSMRTPMSKASMTTSIIRGTILPLTPRPVAIDEDDLDGLIAEQKLQQIEAEEAANDAIEAMALVEQELRSRRAEEEEEENEEDAATWAEKSTIMSRLADVERRLAEECRLKLEALSKLDASERSVEDLQLRFSELRAVAQDVARESKEKDQLIESLKAEIAMMRAKSNVERDAARALPLSSDAVVGATRPVGSSAISNAIAAEEIFDRAPSVPVAATKKSEASTMRVGTQVQIAFDETEVDANRLAEDVQNAIAAKEVELAVSSGMRAFGGALRSIGSIFF